MLEQFHDYFGQIEMPEAVIARAQRICDLSRPLMPQPPQSVFVADFYEQPAGIRRYTSLWLVSDNLLMESKQFVIQDNFDFVLIGYASYIELNSTGLPSLTGPFTQESTLTVNIQFEDVTTGVLAAANNNCKFLFQFLTNYIYPHSSLFRN